jgi:hypothetical protein
LAEGNTVSPPSSTSELTNNKVKKENGVKVCSRGKHCNLDHTAKEAFKKYMNGGCIQIHENGCYPLAPILSVIFIKEVIIVRLIFLSNFIMENLKTFAMLCR